MGKWTRRDVMKSSLAVPLVAAGAGAAEAAAVEQAQEAAAGNAARGAGRERFLMDFGWRFHFGHASDPSKDFGFGGGRSGNFQKTGNFLPASGGTFDDSDWKSVDLPHDWAIELPFQNDPALASKGYYPLGRTYPETSVGWYRRVFDLPASDAGKRISIEFDGAYRETMVVLNGFYIGRHSGGYDPFRFDVTDFATPGGRNILLVRVDATLSDGWFYEGAGIYRHVWLTKTSPVHVRQWGTFVRTRVEPGRATVQIRTEVDNRGTGAANVRVISQILDPAGKPVGRNASDAASIATDGEHAYEQQVEVRQPALWSLEERNLYRLVTEVEAGGRVVDRYETPFGMRTCTFDAQKGFFLNGKPVKVKGTCNHQDHAAVGAALPDAVQEFRVRKLQEMGCNAIRTSHNPPTPELLDACDRLGMLVFDETRMMSSNPEGLAQFENMVRRDRNHPSVFMWSMGNEEGVGPTARGAKILGSMKALSTRHDGTRPVSIAPLGGVTMGQGGFAHCDVMGYNYADPASETYHNAHPDVPVIGTETVSAVCTRGIYITDASKGYVSSYDPYTTTGRASAEGWWRFCNARPWNAGGFIWTGFDYRGEPSPNQWPNISSQYGIIDMCGFPKDTFFYYQSWWTDKPVLHVFPHWNWPGMEGQEIAVWVHSNCDRVELFHNGASLGAKAMAKDSHLAWNVKYAPGTIEARGFKGGKQVLTAKRETTGAPAKLVLRADRPEIAADGEDVAMFAVEVHDAQGRVVPVTDNEVTFRVTGQGRLVGTGNGDPTNQEPDHGATRKAFSGLAMALVQSTKEAGSITVEANSPGLTAASVTIAAKAAKLRPQIAVWNRSVPKGEGLTGLWRPARAAAAARGFGGGDMIFSLVQEGGGLQGTVDNGGDALIPIEEGRIDGANVSFRAGNVTYTGAIAAEQIELRRTGGPGMRPPAAAAAPAEKRPAIGPAPDGSDPSRGPMPAGARNQGPQPLILRRVTR
jgi:beta-galactosidase